MIFSNETNENGTQTLTANDGDVDVGSVTYYIAGEWGSILHIGVLAEHQRQGVAEALLKELRERQPDTKVLPFTGLTPEGKAMAEALYPKYG